MSSALVSVGKDNFRYAFNTAEKPIPNPRTEQDEYAAYLSTKCVENDLPPDAGLDALAAANSHAAAPLIAAELDALRGFLLATEIEDAADRERAKAQRYRQCKKDTLLEAFLNSVGGLQIYDEIAAELDSKVRHGVGDGQRMASDFQMRVGEEKYMQEAGDLCAREGGTDLEIEAAKSKAAADFRERQKSRDASALEQAMRELEEMKAVQREREAQAAANSAKVDEAERLVGLEKEKAQAALELAAEQGRTQPRQAAAAAAEMEAKILELERSLANRDVAAAAPPSGPDAAAAVAAAAADTEAALAAAREDLEAQKEAAVAAEQDRLAAVAAAVKEQHKREMANRAREVKLLAQATRDPEKARDALNRFLNDDVPIGQTCVDSVVATYDAHVARREKDLVSLSVTDPVAASEQLRAYREAGTDIASSCAKTVTDAAHAHALRVDAADGADAPPPAAGGGGKKRKKPPPVEEEEEDLDEDAQRSKVLKRSRKRRNDQIKKLVALHNADLAAAYPDAQRNCIKNAVRSERAVCCYKSLEEELTSLLANPAVGESVLAGKTPAQYVKEIKRRGVEQANANVKNEEYGFWIEGTEPPVELDVSDELQQLLADKEEDLRLAAVVSKATAAKKKAAKKLAGAIGKGKGNGKGKGKAAAVPLADASDEMVAAASGSTSGASEVDDDATSKSPSLPISEPEQGAAPTGDGCDSDFSSIEDSDEGEPVD